MATVNVLSSSDILVGLSNLRDEGLLNDIKLQAEGKSLYAHKALLASVSPYFKALFTGGFKENDEHVIELKDTNFDGLNNVINCCYTTHLDLNIDNLPGILSCAVMIQMVEIVNYCKEYMTNNLSDSTCFQLLKLAEKYDFRDVVQNANKYILANFVTIRQSDDFKRLSKDELMQFLGHDELNTCGDESEAFMAANDWLEYDKERMQHVEEVIKLVRFHSIKVDKLPGIADTDLIDDRKGCRALVRQALTYHTKEFEKPLNKEGVQKSRGREGFYIINNASGEDWNSTEDNKTFKVSFADNISCNSKSVGRFVRFSMLMVQVNEFLFLFAIDNTTFLPVAMRYNGISDEWISLVPVPLGKQATVGSSVALLGDKIYFISGMYITETSKLSMRGEYSNRVFMYSILCNEWKELRKVPKATYFSAANGCVVNESVYVSGGYNHASHDYVGPAIQISDVHAYDDKAEVWLVKPSMNHARGKHIMKCVKDTLYVIGGNYPDNGVNIELFDIGSEQWTDVKQTLDVYASCGIVKDEKIYILGGKYTDPATHKVSMSKIRVFDTKSKEITVHNVSLPKPLAYHVAGLITIPQLLDNKAI